MIRPSDIQKRLVMAIRKGEIKMPKLDDDEKPTSDQNPKPQNQNDEQVDPTRDGYSPSDFVTGQN